MGALSAHTFRDCARSCWFGHRDSSGDTFTAGWTLSGSIQPQTDHSRFANFQRPDFARTGASLLATPRHPAIADLARGERNLERDRRDLRTPSTRVSF